MIAPAMNTRPQEALPYRDLARERARISRCIRTRDLERLRKVVVEDVVPEPDARLRVGLEFHRTSSGLTRVRGRVTGTIGLTCNGCAEALAHNLDLPLNCLIVATEAMATRVGAEAGARGALEDLVVAGGEEVTVAQIVEDEVLLSLPERLCGSEPCQRLPGLDYPAAAGAAAREEDAPGLEAEPGGPAGTERGRNPFSVLAELTIQKKAPSD